MMKICFVVCTQHTEIRLCFCSANFVWCSYENVSHILMIAQLLYLMCQDIWCKNRNAKTCLWKFPLPAVQFQQCTLLWALCDQLNSLKKTNPAKICKGLCHFRSCHPTEWSSELLIWENEKGGIAQLASESSNFPIVSFYIYALGKESRIMDSSLLQLFLVLMTALKGNDRQLSSNLQLASKH